MVDTTNNEAIMRLPQSFSELMDTLEGEAIVWLPYSCWVLEKSMQSLLFSVDHLTIVIKEGFQVAA